MATARSQALSSFLGWRWSPTGSTLWTCGAGVSGGHSVTVGCSMASTHGMPASTPPPPRHGHQSASRQGPMSPVRPGAESPSVLAERSLSQYSQLRNSLLLAVPPREGDFQRNKPDLLSVFVAPSSCLDIHRLGFLTWATRRSWHLSGRCQENEADI